MESERKTVPSGLPQDFTVEELSFYYEEMLRSGLTELEVETPKGKLILKRATLEADVYPAPIQSAGHRRPQSAEPEVLPPSVKVLASPIIGMFYRASSPQSAPFVREGDTVNGGATLCIVEAMKVMNEIKAETRCRVLKILGENGKPVTKGQPLFHVEPL